MGKFEQFVKINQNIKIQNGKMCTNPFKTHSWYKTELNYVNCPHHNHEHHILCLTLTQTPQPPGSPDCLEMHQLCG